MKKYFYFASFLLAVSAFYFGNNTEVVAQTTETGHWVPYYGGNPSPIEERCAGTGSSCIIGDKRPPGVE